MEKKENNRLSVSQLDGWIRQHLLTEEAIKAEERRAGKSDNKQVRPNSFDKKGQATVKSIKANPKTLDSFTSKELVDYIRTSNGICWHCSELGHWIRDCPTKHTVIKSSKLSSEKKKKKLKRQVKNVDEANEVPDKEAESDDSGTDRFAEPIALLANPAITVVISKKNSSRVSRGVIKSVKNPRNPHTTTVKKELSDQVAVNLATLDSIQYISQIQAITLGLVEGSLLPILADLGANANLMDPATAKKLGLIKENLAASIFAEFANLSTFSIS